MSVELEEVLSQGAYMLLYSRFVPEEFRLLYLLSQSLVGVWKLMRMCKMYSPSLDRVQPRPSCLKPLNKEQQMVKIETCPMEEVEHIAHGESGGPICSSSSPLSDSCLCPEVDVRDLSARMKSEAVKEHFRDADVVIPESASILKAVSSSERELSSGRKSEASRQGQEEDTNSFKAGLSLTNSSKKASYIAVNPDTVREDTTERDMTYDKTCQSVLEEEEEVSTCREKDLSISGCENNNEDSEIIDMVESESASIVAMDIESHSNGHTLAADETDLQVEHAHKLDSATSLSSDSSKAEHHKSSKRVLPPHTLDFQDGNGLKRIEIMGGNSSQ